MTEKRYAYYDGSFERIQEDAAGGADINFPPPSPGGQGTQVGGHHYESLGDYEPIKVIKAWLTTEEYIGFLKGNILKYHARAGKKEGVSAEMDMRKADQYQGWLVEALNELEAGEQ